MRSDTAGAPAMLFSLRRVARMALGIAAGAAGVLAVTVFFLGDGSGASYDELIRSRSLNQQLLGPALAIGGLVLVTFSAALIWGIALYSSFRVAGPLFRLTRNLETAVARGPGKPIPIRAPDRLHAEADLLEQALLEVAAHYRALDTEIASAMKALQAGALPHAAQRELAQRLREQLSHARF